MKKPKLILPNQTWQFTYDDDQKFIHIIVSVDPDGFRCYSDRCQFIKGHLNIKDLLHGDDWKYLGDVNPISKDGATCSKCTNFVPMAVNDLDGSFVCCSCRLGF